MSEELARYTDANGSEVVLTDVDIARVICDNPNVTRKEMKLFVELCKAHGLNPFIKEAHLVKYGDKPATIVVGKDVFTKRAARNPRFKGYKAGILVSREGQVTRREGSVSFVGESIVGGWCEVHLDGYDVPMFDSVSFDEYAGRKRDGSLNAQWSGKPGTMIRKVAVVHALREAFPDDFGGLYDAAEMWVDTAGAPDRVDDAIEPEEGAGGVDASAVEAAKARLWEACKAYAEKHGSTPEKISEGVKERPDYAEDAEFFELVAEEFEAEL